MSVVPRDRRIAGGVAVAASLLVGLTLLAALPAPGAVSTAGGVGSLDALVPCASAILPHAYNGTVAIDGAAAAAPLPLNVSYREMEAVSYSGGSPISLECVNESATVDATNHGTFSFSIDPAPISNCSSAQSSTQLCTTFTGPYVAVGVAPTTVPAGDFSVTAQNGTSFAVSVDAYLASVRLAPGPVATFSNGAVDALSAEALTGAGNRTPMATTYAWAVSGSGWAFVGPASGATVEVTAAPGAAIGNVSVIARASVDGTPVRQSASEELVAVPTTISSAELNRTALDAGQSVAAQVVGGAAGNYSYVASFAPGLDAPAVTVPCATTPAAAGTVSLSCAATLGFPTTGVAQPTVTVSNGASAATWTFPDVVVSPGPTLALDPVAPVGYATVALPITVTASPGTGTGPYGEACLATGAGTTTCDASAGPTWTFDPTYPRPGNYSATAWAIDAVGVNRSVSTTVRIVAPFSATLAAPLENASAGAPVALTAVLGGGDLPARLWWNVSGEATPLATGWVVADGPVHASFVPASPGFVTVSLAAVDALGTLASAQTSIAVSLGAATQVATVGLPPSSSVRAGTAFGVAWQALDVGGSVVRDFASAAEIELTVAGTGRTAAGTVNASGVGPLPSALPGWFDVPASAWIGGALNVSVSCDVAGPIAVTLSVATPLAGGTGSVQVTVLPDIQHLVLSDPVPAATTGRSSATLYQVTDRYGNAAPGGWLVVTASWTGGTTQGIAPVLAEADGATEVWVNYTIPGASAGTVVVTDPAGATVLPTIAVPGLASPLADLALVPIAAAVGVGGTAGAVALTRRPRRGTAPTPVAEETGEPEDAELRRLAEGRATVVELVGRVGPIDAEGLATLWTPPPAPPELADWVASLLADGTLAVATGDDGHAQYSLAPPPPEPPAVTVDSEALDRAERRRAALEAEWAEGDSAGGP